MKGRAVIRLDFPSEKDLKIVLEALEPETRTLSTRRSRVQVKGERKSLTLIFEARDTTALRAAINSYLRWVHLTKTILESVDELQLPKELEK